MRGAVATPVMTLDVTGSGEQLECLALDASACVLPAPARLTERWPDQKPVRSRERDPSQSCRTVVSSGLAPDIWSSLEDNLDHAARSRRLPDWSRHPQGHPHRSDALLVRGSP